MPMLDLKGVSLYYNVKGNGLPIVFIHPPLLTCENFRYQMEELSQYFKVISFDIRGHGRSQYSLKPITYHLIAEDITHLLDYLGIEKAFLCGYSTGSSVALEFMLTYPDRAFGSILVSGMSEASDFYNRKRISLSIKLANPATFSILAKAITIGNADSMETFKTLYWAAEKGDVKNINQYFQYSLEYNCTEQLENIELPVLLIYGEKDKSFHQYAKLLHEKLRYNELKFLSNEKHQIPTKATPQLNQLIIDFVHLHNKS
ncbi:pimeloyl-ACP methyl ester carboxylesterase [Neobacillus niacini]|uniref:alpha/beta fold hydrolase n=1 Tax=Neobacillus niacini TaxID=86668 RepID=UPI002780CCD5|nr:alpha/beta hydrolase [Neobacillus niacini]MDQ1003128.1 pimeloyl-ACP methyl ester carboxylesterase [Neobacillus niacini]